MTLMADTTTTDKPNSATKTDPNPQVQVKLAHPHLDNGPGDTIKVDAIEAKRLRRVGIAEPAD